MQRNRMMLGVLAVIAAGSAWTALVDDTLPQLHLAMAAAAVVLAVFVALSGHEFPVRPAPATGPAPSRRRLGTVLAVSGALACVLWVRFGPWVPAADFDIAGFLFVIQNIWQLTLLAVFALIAFVGLMLVSHGQR